VKEQGDREERGGREDSGRRLFRKLLRPGAILVVVLAGILACAYWWFYLHGRVATDDAYVKAHSASISSRIWGTVIQVLVDNNDRVREGQVLVLVDPDDYQTAIDGALAILNRREADVKRAEINVDLLDSQTASQVKAAQAQLERAREEEKNGRHQIEQAEERKRVSQADLAYARDEYQRQEELYRKRAISQQAYDDALKKVRVAEADVKAAVAEIEGLRASLLASQEQVNQAEAGLEIAQSGRKEVQMERHTLESLRAQRDEARSSLEQARLNLSYCTIKAPLGGAIAQRDVQVGDRIQPGVPIMSVVPLERIYGEANFKETDLTHMRPGQPARIKADIYPDRIFSGKVSGIGAGTGAAFSVLPPQNATGNWIKVVQRVPVTIDLDRPLPPEYPLRVGLSLTVTVDTREP